MGYYDQESNYVGNSDFGVQRYNFRTNVSNGSGTFETECYFGLYT